ncbi:MAG: helix-turn-helix domain-containing protein [Geminicoccales bacterium]
MIEPQIIEKDGTPEYAVIPVAEWRRIEAMLDELEDIRALDAAFTRPDRRMIPFEVTSAILDGASPIRAWREHQGLSQGALAEAAGIASSRLAELEAGKREAAPDELQRLAQALQVQVDDLTDPPPG